MQPVAVLPVVRKRVQQYFEEYLKFFTISKFVCIYSITCQGTPTDYMKNPSWETLTYSEEEYHLYILNISTT